MAIPPSIERLRARVLRSILPFVQATFGDQASAVIEEVLAAQTRMAIARAVQEFDFIPDTQRAFRRVYVESFNAFGGQAWSDVQVFIRERPPVPEPRWSRRAIDYLDNQGAEFVALVSDNTRSEINRLLAESFAEGQGPADAARSLEDRLPDLTRVRSNAIARTEMLRSSSVSNFEAAEEIERRYGIAMKKTWLHSGQAAPPARFDHVALDGTTVGLHENFNVGGERALYPRAASLSAEATVNCKCSHAVEPDDTLNDPMAIPEVRSRHRQYLESLNTKSNAEPEPEPEDERTEAQHRWDVIRDEHPAMHRRYGSVKVAMYKQAERHDYNYDTVRKIVYRIKPYDK